MDSGIDRAKDNLLKSVRPNQPRKDASLPVMLRRCTRSVMSLRILVVLLCMAPSVVGAEDTARASVEVLPSAELFEPLLADPSWPRFSAEHQWRFGTDEFDRVAQVGFGETIALIRSAEESWGRWEFGFQAMLDAVFDLTASSLDLSNEDYFAAFVGTIEAGGLVTQLRFSHLSSHLGDEYVAETGRLRDSVSFETIDVLVSKQWTEAVRVYGGVGVLITPEPAFDPLIFQLGGEWVSPIAFAEGWLRPVFGVDVQVRQENDFVPDVSALLALRIENEEEGHKRIEFFARFYHGRSPDGQFFRQTVDTLGVGIRLGF